MFLLESSICYFLLLIFYKDEKKISFLSTFFLFFTFLLGMRSFLETAFLECFFFLLSFLYQKLTTPKKTVVLIQNGVVNFKELSELSYSFEKLLFQLRKKGLKSAEEVEYAELKGNHLFCLKK